ncbi:UDP-N-acetylmuramoyl-tripeptide--D-alanyl-D-alanine ligase [Patescibacteria group bacterium]
MKNINPVVRWWVTPELPYHDIYEPPLLKNKSRIAFYIHLFSHWVIHPIKRRLARWYLRFLQKTTDIKVIGVTGSAGKSITVQMIASILKCKGTTLCTLSSVDSVYNIPNTILRCLPNVKYLVLEMSVEYPGEMDYYLWLAKPDIGVITNIFPTHTEFLKDVHGVLKEKGKLVRALEKNDFAVLNRDNTALKEIANNLKTRVVWFDSNVDLDIQNANAAIAVAKLLGIGKDEIKKGLETYKRPEHRFKVIKHKSKAVIVDDSYNSNPEALLSVLNKFNKLAGHGTKIAVLGDMLELGKISSREHKRVGREIAKSGFDVVIGVGDIIKDLLDEVSKKSSNTRTYHFSKQEEVLPLLKTYLKKNTFVLIKGSRSIGLDKVVDGLIK